MKKKLLDQLAQLEAGFYYRCLRRKEPESFSSPLIEELEAWVFYKENKGKYPYLLVGSDNIFTPENLLKNCRGEFTPLYDIQRIS